jgi:hypothetical protein
MSLFRGAAVSLAVMLCGAPVLTQGIPGTRAYIEAQNKWEAIRDGRHQDAAEALALDAEPRDPSNHFGSGLAAYDGRIRLSVGGADANPGEFERVIVHEFTHVLVQTLALRGVPMWLHEGLAVMFEPNGETWIDEQLSRSHAPLPLERLAGSFGDLSGDDARLAHAQSAGIVRGLFESDGPLTVGTVLQDIARGDTFTWPSSNACLCPTTHFWPAWHQTIDLLS